jgi:hypothetical protein
MNYKKGLRRSLKNHFGKGFALLDDLLQTLPLALPHTKHSQWQRVESPGQSGAKLKGGTSNKTLSVTLTYTQQGKNGKQGRTFLLKSELTKGRAFGNYERAFANCVAREIGRVVNTMLRAGSDDLLVGPQDVLDAAVADFLKEVTHIDGPNFLQTIRFLKNLAQQSYETKSITYGTLLSPRRETKKNVANFPRDVVDQKRFQALTDGYKTALMLDRTGKIVRVISLRQENEVGEHFRPVWLDPLADSARTRKAVGITLTRTGAILVAWQGNLLLSYRLGRWILWYHNENVEIISEGLRHQGRKPKGIGRLAARLYRCALDVSFRRTGGLFVVLRSPKHLDRLVPKPEQLGGMRRTIGDRALGEWLANNTMTGLDREVLSDLAALDGAIVCDRAGKLLSYGSVLLLPKAKGLGKIEGSRSRAAHSSSFLGLSIKVSSDGGIDVIKSGEKLLSL